MTSNTASGRRWTADGSTLLAPDMDAEIPPIFERAVAEYGPEQWDNGWAIGGVVFHGANPITRPVPGHPLVVIVLHMEGVDDMNNALAFLAHELVHCLCLGKEEHSAPMIEEGAAVRFSIMEAARRDPVFAAVLQGHQTTAPGAENYAEALMGVERLLAIEPEAIRRLRTEDPDWAAITAERILKVAPSCPPELAAVLAEVREMRPDREREAALAILAEREGRV